GTGAKTAPRAIRGGSRSLMTKELALLVEELAHQLQQPRTQIVALERPRQVRAQIAELVPGVVAHAVDGEAEHARALLRQLLEPVGQLDLAAFARFGMRQDLPDLRRQDVTPDDGQARWRAARCRLLHHVVNLDRARRI